MIISWPKAPALVLFWALQQELALSARVVSRLLHSRLLPAACLGMGLAVPVSILLPSCASWSLPGFPWTKVPDPQWAESSTHPSWCYVPSSKLRDSDAILLVVPYVDFFQKGVLNSVGVRAPLQKLVHFLSPFATHWQIWNFKIWPAQQGLLLTFMLYDCLTQPVSFRNSI